MTDIARYAHRHVYPNGNIHLHVHPVPAEHPDPYLDAHPDPADGLPCVDCEPCRAQQAAILAALGEAAP